MNLIFPSPHAVASQKETRAQQGVFKYLKGLSSNIFFIFRTTFILSEIGAHPPQLVKAAASTIIG